MAKKAGVHSGNLLDSWYLLNPGIYPLGGKRELRPRVGHCSNFTAILKGPVIGKTGVFQVYLENVALENI